MIDHWNHIMVRTGEEDRELAENRDDAVQKFRILPKFV